nr:MAG TPA: hypothetical protein [Caudoviricetes sp.]DAS98407.1 MAG TPA: hypothetical protein [Bacteriophage sp.]
MFKNRPHSDSFLNFRGQKGVRFYRSLTHLR